MLKCYGIKSDLPYLKTVAKWIVDNFKDSMHDNVIVMSSNKLCQKIQSSIIYYHQYVIEKNQRALCGIESNSSLVLPKIVSISDLSSDFGRKHIPYNMADSTTESLSLAKVLMRYDNIVSSFTSAIILAKKMRNLYFAIISQNIKISDIQLLNDGDYPEYLNQILILLEEIYLQWQEDLLSLQMLNSCEYNNKFFESIKDISMYKQYLGNTHFIFCGFIPFNQNITKFFNLDFARSSFIFPSSLGDLYSYIYDNDQSALDTKVFECDKHILNFIHSVRNSIESFEYLSCTNNTVTKVNKTLDDSPYTYEQTLNNNSVEYHEFVNEYSEADFIVEKVRSLFNDRINSFQYQNSTHKNVRSIIDNDKNTKICIVCTGSTRKLIVHKLIPDFKLIFLDGYSLVDSNIASLFLSAASILSYNLGTTSENYLNKIDNWLSKECDVKLVIKLLQTYYMQQNSDMKILLHILDLSLRGKFVKTHQCVLDSIDNYFQNNVNVDGFTTEANHDISDTKRDNIVNFNISKFSSLYCSILESFHVDINQKNICFGVYIQNLIKIVQNILSISKINTNHLWSKSNENAILHLSDTILRSSIANIIISPQDYYEILFDSIKNLKQYDKNHNISCLHEINENKNSPTHTTNYICISDAENSSMLDFDYVFIPECTDEKWPGAVKSNIWLPRCIMEKIESSELFHKEINYMYFNILTSKKNVYITRSNVYDERYSMQSTFVSYLNSFCKIQYYKKERKQSACIVNTKKNSRMDQHQYKLTTINYKYSSDTFDKKGMLFRKENNSIPTVQTDKIKYLKVHVSYSYNHNKLRQVILPKYLSATSIEKIMHNRYGFYAEKVLKLKKIEDIAPKISRADFGNALHIILKNSLEYIEQVKSEKCTYNLDDNCKIKAQDPTVQKIIVDTLRAYPCSYAKIWREQITNILDCFLRMNINRNFQKTYVEYRGSIPISFDKMYKFCNTMDCSTGSIFVCFPTKNFNCAPHVVQNLNIECEQNIDITYENNNCISNTQNVVTKYPPPFFSVLFNFFDNDLHTSNMCGQQNYSSSNHTNINIMAIADRIDIINNGEICIIDYKTGQVPSKNEIIHGLKPQLIIEAIILINNGFSPIIYDGFSVKEEIKLLYIKCIPVKPYIQVHEYVVSKSELLNHFDKIKDLVSSLINQDAYFYDVIPNKTLKYNNYKHLQRIESN